MPAHGVSGVYLYGAPVTYKDDPATIRQHPEVFIQIDIGQHLKNHVHALAFGGIHDLLRGIGIVMVDHMMGTLFGDKGLSPIGAGGTYHRQIGSPCQLYGSRTYPAAGAVNEDCFTGYTYRLLKQSAIGGNERHIDTRALSKRNIVGQWMDLGCGA